MKVYIIGAGPGDPDLITVKGAKLIEKCPIIVYTGSLVPKKVVERANENAALYDSSGMNLDEITELFIKAHHENKDVARVHTGDPSIYGAIEEQTRRLNSLGIEWEIIPGVSSFLASAAAIGKELTLPEVSQTVILTRVEGRTPVPKEENLIVLARTGATLILYLSIGLIRKLVDNLKSLFNDEHPVVIVHKASWPDQKVIWGNLGNIIDKVEKAKIKSTAIIITGKVLTSKDFPDSKLYSSDFSHNFRYEKGRQE